MKSGGRSLLIRIVGIQRNLTPDREFILLQNQGSMRVTLRGHAVMAEGADLAVAAHAFSDEVAILPGAYILLFTGPGEARWAKSKDGATVYHTYMGRNQSVWEHQPGPIHLLTTQHTYSERGPSLALR